MGEYPYIQKKFSGKRHDEHRIIMEKHIGRKLDRFELVHHINEDKKDNRIENLQVMSPKEHSSYHNQKYPLTWKCEVCGIVFTPKPSKRGWKQKTCSRRCGLVLLSIKNRKPGRRRSMYRPDATPSEISARSQVAAVFIRSFMETNNGNVRFMPPDFAACPTLNDLTQTNTNVFTKQK